MGAVNTGHQKGTAFLGAIVVALCLLIISLSLANTAAANDPHTNHCVRPDGMGGCFSTIQQAVDAAMDDDTITIAAGTYTESVFITHNLSITGGWQPVGWPLTETVVQANGADCALSLDELSGSLSNLIVSGAISAGICGTDLMTYTLTNINAMNNVGHGTAVSVSHALTVSQSNFRDNGRNGLHIPCPYWAPDKPRRIIVRQSTAGGNEIGIAAGCVWDLIIEQNHLQDNRVGVHVSFNSSVESANNLYTDNATNGVVIQGSWWRGANDTITNNGEAGVLFIDDPAPSCAPPTVDFINSIIWDNGYGTFGWLEHCYPHTAFYYVDFSYSIIYGRDAFLAQPDADVIQFFGGPAVYNSPPRFMGGSDYRLQPLSPAIDRGTADNAPLVDIDGQPRPIDGDGDSYPTFDMGAYEAPPGIIWRSFLPSFHNQ